MSPGVSALSILEFSVVVCVLDEGDLHEHTTDRSYAVNTNNCANDT